MVVGMYATVCRCISLGKFKKIFFSGHWINGWKIKKRKKKKLKSHQASAFNRRHLMFNMKFVNRQFFFLFVLYSSLDFFLVLLFCSSIFLRNRKLQHLLCFCFYLYVLFVVVWPKTNKKIVFCNSQYFFVWFLFGEYFIFYFCFSLLFHWCSKKGESERRIAKKLLYKQGQSVRIE